VDERERRIGLNEALFREVNERVEELQATHLREGQLAERDDLLLICECGDESCEEQLVVPVAEYERVRAHGDWFAVVPGHASGTVEHVVERHDGYEVVEKHGGAPTAQAKRTDPRARP
jgi:hypothetical protein